ncbi:MAG TPA: phage portal protein [Planctomycetota bacterium]|nr:phage portal protein [Planctomycetota bacterium]
MRGFFRKLFGSPKRRSANPAGQTPQQRALVRSRRIRAYYDAARTTNDNSRHWAAADNLSANAANSLFVRRMIRQRARYEVANNSYLKGQMLTLANDCIGTGPRLQLTTPRGEVNKRVERLFCEWAKAVHLAAKLRTMKQAKVIDGEAFAVFSTNRTLKSRIKLDITPIECDRVTSPYGTYASADVDGIEFDDEGNPRRYAILRDHPGDFSGSLAYDWWQAQDVIHWFREDRPGQRRGISELAPCLELHPMLRRYTLATLTAAETTADFAGVMQTNAPADEDNDQVATPFETMELERGMMTQLPEGWQLGQIDAKQPTTTYPMFKREVINEQARCILMPYNIAAGDSSSYNYASGRLDHQGYFKAINVDQDDDEIIVVDRIFERLVDEMMQWPDLRALKSLDLDHQWVWHGTEHVDPLKEANAQAIRLKNNTSTLAEEYAKRGQDYEEALATIAKTLRLIKDLEEEYDVKFPTEGAGGAIAAAALDPDVLAETVAESIRLAAHAPEH